MLVRLSLSLRSTTLYCVMGSTPSPIDAHTLAAFIAGTLDDDRRRAVIEHLAQHPDDREWLHMALEAQAAAHAPEATPERADRAGVRPTGPSRPAARRGHRRRWLLGAVASLVLLAGLSIVLVPPSDTIRTTLPDDAPLTVTIDEAPLAFFWDDVPEAYSYRVVVWDPQAATVVDEYSTSAPRLPAGDAFFDALLPQLQAGRTYQVRVDAIDAQNRRIRSSAATAFVAPGA